MIEERGCYNAHRGDQDGGVDGVKRIGDILREFIDEHGWPLRVGITQANGNRASDCDDHSNDDA